MSIRANGSGDNLLHAASWGVSTGSFSNGIWVKQINDRNAIVNFMAFGDAASDPSDLLMLGTQSDGTGAVVYDIDGSHFSPPPTITVGTWFWIVFGRSGSELSLRVFDDSTSTTPVYSEVTGTVATDYSALDNIIIGQAFSGEWPDAEFTNAKSHVGVHWSDAQCRTESQNFGIQTGGGTAWGAWGLESIAHGVEGLQDLTGNGRTLTNTGCVDGASRPTQLEAATSGGTTPTATESVTVSDTFTAGGFTASVSAAES